MDPLVARIRRTMRRHSLVPVGGRVLVAISGGADSMVLLHVLRELETTGDCSLAGAAHLHHGIRGAAADEDEAFCRMTAARFGLPLEYERVDVTALARARGVSLEAAGHQARYEFFERAAARLHADRIALGHTRDDQAETFLLRLLRGAGPRGLAGMHPCTGIFIRPMLDCSREEVRAFASGCGVAFREDDTNADPSIPRNLIRHDVLPFLARLTPGLTRVLAREAAIARDDARLLAELAETAFTRAVEVSAEEICVDIRQLRREPPAVARRVAVLAISSLAGSRSVTFEHAERLLDLARDDDGPQRASLPGQIGTRAAGLIVLRRDNRGRAAQVVPDSGTNFRFLLSIPGEVSSPAGWTLSAERTAWLPPTRNDSGSDFSRKIAPGDIFGAENPCPEAVFGHGGAGAEADGVRCATLDATGISGPLVVRNWLPGDRVRPLGMKGTRKLQDLFVDRKVPRPERSRLPIVVDTADRVLWVAGHVVAEDFRVTRATSDVVILKLKYWRKGT